MASYENQAMAGSSPGFSTAVFARPLLTVLLMIVATLSQSRPATGLSILQQTTTAKRRSSSASALFVSSYNPFRGHYQNHHQSSRAKAARARPLPLSQDDLRRLDPRHPPTQPPVVTTQTVPLVLLDPLLPHQRMYFSSSDPKFEQLLRYLRHEQQQCDDDQSREPHRIGIMGFDPSTGRVLPRGVLCTVPVADGVTYGLTQSRERVVATSFKATSTLFRVVGEPWTDPTGSFYMADVEELPDYACDQAIERERPPSSLSPSSSYAMSEQWFVRIPALVEQWKSLVYQTEWTTPAGLPRHHQLGEIGGAMPATAAARAWWVASLLNPVGKVPLSTEQQDQAVDQGLAPPRSRYMTSRDLRPHMLSCANEEERLALAVAALQASCDFLRRFAAAERERRGGRQ